MKNIWEGLKNNKCDGIFQFAQTPFWKVTKGEPMSLYKLCYLDRLTSQEYHGGPHKGSIFKNEAAIEFAISKSLLLVPQFWAAPTMIKSAPAKKLWLSLERIDCSNYYQNYSSI